MKDLPGMDYWTSPEHRLAQAKRCIAAAAKHPEAFKKGNGLALLQQAQRRLAEKATGDQA